jgi:uncharacterized protein (DUF2252 family)
MKTPGKQYATREERRSAGRALRDKLSRVAQGNYNAQARKFDPVELMKKAHDGRVAELLPLKNARMAQNAFSFFRGAAPLMAADLAVMPNTGIELQISGDAHVQNLGAFGGGQEGKLIFDINDFDETIHAPWEWDVKRMATSLVLAGREAGNPEQLCKESVSQFSRCYRENMQKFSELSVLELSRYLVMRELQVPIVRSVLHKAEREKPIDSLGKLAHEEDGSYQFKVVKDKIFPVNTQTPLKEAESRKVLAALPGYMQTLQPERRHFFKQYQPVACAFRIVGTGSVGTRDYAVLMFAGAVADPMFLQIKQEVPSAYAPYLPKAGVPQHQGQRVVEGIRRTLVQTDPFLGWATVEGRPYLVRLLRDHKGGVETTDLRGKALAQYAQVCGELLAKGHARSGDPCLLAGYLGSSDRFDRALVNFAVDYADQTDRDYEAWVDAIADGRVEALEPIQNTSAKRKGAKKARKKAAKKKTKKKQTRKS